MIPSKRLNKHYRKLRRYHGRRMVWYTITGNTEAYARHCLAYLVVEKYLGE